MPPANTRPIRRIAITTGGGDAPGLNAVICAVTRAALQRGWDCIGIRDGYDGLLRPERYPQGGCITLTRERVEGIAALGGTLLGSTNKGDPFAFPTAQADGSIALLDRSEDLLDALARERVDALVAVGGDGSLAIAHRLAQRGLCVVGVPKTIDNDLDGTVTTFGFDTAVGFASECIDRLHTTAASHHRVFVVEVMGRYAGWIALHAGLAGGAHAILLPELPFDLAAVAGLVAQRDARGLAYSIVVVAEGAYPRDGVHALLGGAEAGHAERLGGMGEQVSAALARLTGKDARCVVLGHLLRGGSPSAFDRVAALRFGAAAVRALAAGQADVMVALDGNDVRPVPLADVAGRMKAVPLDGDTLATARDLGICLGG
ncbi:6-phosphofructokinase [Roseateles saccharophilus]|uniref:ATP-dependent 6-phosphofructokinase n=1 Tax=Roseateles saccharophilus TaxID=304 RepID=A0A4R3VB70_ROSSA|nr:ATP-dependent 6-phosphofructokinase [Roseateles saccharophilus]MDG0835602.1 ATP-dependent 6-phosphofructokinase [Roseateles saccharophilus]TCV01033.1 6-phosphofructokinase [Roseateles saccharophilus]